LLLHVDEFIEREGRTVLRQVNKDGLRESLQVVLNTVLHDIVNVDNELIKLAEALMNVVEEALDVHGGPGKTADTGAEAALEIVDVRCKETTGVGTDLVHNTDALAYDVLKLVVVVLELFFLEQDDFSALRDFNSNTGKAFGLTDKGHDFAIKVDVELQVLVVTNEEGSLKTGFSSLNFLLPLFTPHVFIRE
jgi:hypothetical protein